MNKDTFIKYGEYVAIVLGSVVTIESFIISEWALGVMFAVITGITIAWSVQGAKS